MAPTIDLSAEVYRKLEELAKPFAETTPDAVLRRILRIDATHNSAEDGSFEEKTELAQNGVEPGALMPLLFDGLVRPGDELVWKRPRKHQVFVATITWFGAIELDDGRCFDSPSAAAVELAGGSQNGWTAWQHSPSSQLLDALRRQSESRDRPPSQLLLQTVLKLLPPGTWISYESLATLVGEHALAVRKYLRETPGISNAHRCLPSPGKVHHDFSWPGEDLGDVNDVLHGEGIRIDDDHVADPRQRLDVTALRNLIESAEQQH